MDVMRTTIATLISFAALAALPAAAPAGEIDLSSCKYLANTACQYLPPTSVDDVCGIVDATTNFSCTDVSTTRQS